MASKSEDSVKAGSDKAKAAKEVATRFELPKTKVHVKPIVRSGRWLPEGHSGSFMYDHTVLGIQVPIDRDTGRLKNPLTPEEVEFFENDAGLDLEKGALNPFRKKDNFWEEFRVAIRKSDDIVTDQTVLMTLDLSQPMSYLQYKVLLTNSNPSGGLVAPDWESRNASGTYKIALVHEGQQHAENELRADKMEKIYKYLAKINNSEEELFDFLTIYYLEGGKTKRPSTDSSKSFYKSEIQGIIDDDIDGIIRIIEDAKNYEYKLLVHRGLKIGALVMKSGNNIETVDGMPVGTGLHQAIQWFKDDRHQDEYLRLKNQIDLAK